MSKPACVGQRAALHEVGRRILSMSARSSSRGTWTCRRSRESARRDTSGQLPFSQRLVHAPPSRAASSPCGRRGRAACTIFALELRVAEIDDALATRRVRVVPQAGAARRDARLGRRAGHLDDTPGRRRRPRGCRGARGASRPARRHRAEYWHIGETTTRFSSTMSRSRNGVNIGGGGFVDVDARSRCCLHLSREPAVDRVDERRRRAARRFS